MARFDLLERRDCGQIVNGVTANGGGATNLFERRGAGLSAIDHVRDISLRHLQPLHVVLLLISSLLVLLLANQTSKDLLQYLLRSRRTDHLRHG